MLETLKTAVWEANMALPRYGLVTFTWGNVSARDHETGHILIKPSGVDYEALKPGDIVVLDKEGRVIEGSLRPSSDTPTHLALYARYPDLGGIVHSHSPQATSWAQAERAIPLYGTTHADYFFGPVPCARLLTQEEIATDYEHNTGLVIIETLDNLGINPMHTPGALCAKHGSFTWGKDAAQAVYHAVVLEEVARMATLTETINPSVKPAPEALRDKHFYRKHGPDAYYGQG
ncbi:MAG: L-ribulose-5-phosphate 4-epimerase [Eubacteriales bacterium]|nr:L-ribulose-5-phosphate 4-epimerase [Eubacteriales bacterium]